MASKLNVELGPTLEKVIAWVKSQRGRVVIDPYWGRLVGLTLVAGVTFIIVARSAEARTLEYRREIVRLQRVQAEVDRWVASVEWPSPEETESLGVSESIFSRLDAYQLQPLALANLISQRSEEVGSGDIRIQLVAPDSAYIPPAQQVGNWQVTPGEIALAVSYTGDWTSVIALLGALPPQVEISGMELQTGDGVVTLEMMLLSREITALP